MAPGSAQAGSWGTGHGLPKGILPWFAAGLKSVCRKHFEDLPGRGEGRRRRDCVNVGVCVKLAGEP